MYTAISLVCILSVTAALPAHIPGDLVNDDNNSTIGYDLMDDDLGNSTETAGNSTSPSSNSAGTAENSTAVTIHDLREEMNTLTETRESSVTKSICKMCVVFFSFLIIIIR